MIAPCVSGGVDDGPADSESLRLVARISVLIRGVLLRLDRIRLTMVFAIDASNVIAASVLAVLLRFDFTVPPEYGRVLKFALVVWPAAKLAVFAAVGMHKRSWRRVSIPDLARLLAANTLGSLVGALVLVPLHVVVPWSILLLDLVLCFLATSTPRVFARAVSEFAPVVHTANSRRRRVAIYGAGSDGVALLREIRRDPSLKYEVCGFIDDSPRKKGYVVYGVRVLGAGAELDKVADKYGIELALIAMPSVSGADMCRILEHCRKARIESKTVTSISERIGRSGPANQLRDVSVEDLLGRSPVRLEQDRIQAKIAGSVVLVTGAAGSIGSEICRQVARFQPRAIIGFEIAESPLFALQQEMARAFPDVPFHPAIGSIQSRQRLTEVFRAYRPRVVYHAAAYKHVPMMEAHVFEAVENNIFGTLNVALVADDHGVEELVMISSDKAVRPTSIMGVTKRVAELVILSLQKSRVKYLSVRFGNVLGSNGSVVPIFKEQIARGGPVTVTHPEMRRYFMTIPEACQLVIQASTMGRGGEIFMLDMGKPVRIVDLARNLILLSGLRPDEDIAIEFTGIRPGEKLYEELSSADEDMIPTYHEKIQIYSSVRIADLPMQSRLAELRRACDSRDMSQLILALKEIAPEYNPSGDVLRRVLTPKSLARTAAAHD